MEFSRAENSALRDARVAVFRGVVILDAQPPIEPSVLAKVQKRVSGPIPSELINLWRVAFGGRLNYDLRVTFPGAHQVSLSFTELFFPGSDGYRDLCGWIDHEQELARESARGAGKKWSGALSVLPFGGFEHLERLYVLVPPDAEAGAVVAWRQGLPPAWLFSHHDDRIGMIARGVNELFEKLNLERDPWSANADTPPTGTETLEAIDALAKLGNAGRSASDKLSSLVRSRIVDWQAAVRDGSVATRPLELALALERAAQNDDVALLSQLKTLGCDLASPVQGGTSALEHAFARGSLQAARFLIAAGLSVTQALRYGAHAVDLEFARELLEKGAEVDEYAVYGAVEAGNVAVATAMIDARRLSLSSLQLAIKARQRAFDAAQTADRIEAGTLASNRSAQEERARAALLNELADRVDPTL
jgi:hypothetical protein